jgi:hypothetical protein
MAIPLTFALKGMTKCLIMRVGMPIRCKKDSYGRFYGDYGRTVRLCK